MGVVLVTGSSRVFFRSFPPLPFWLCTPVPRVGAGTGLPEEGFGSHPETGSRRIPRCSSTSLHPRPPILGSSSLVSMLPAGRHSGRSGHTAHGTAVLYSAWHTSIAGVEVLVLCRWGYLSFLTCPRT